MMIQLSVYARICNGQDRLDKHLQRMERNLPTRGSVRALQLTDKQYERMRLLVGKPSNNEKPKTEQLVLF